MSWSLLYNVGRLALSKSSSYVSQWDLYMARLNARSCIRSTFLLSDDLQKCHIRWQYVRLGKTKVSYSNSLALDGIKCLKQDSIPTFWLVLLHRSLICFFKSRSSSMWTPSSLLWLSTASLVSPSIFLGLIFRSWNFSGLADKRLIEYHIRACLQLVFSCCPTISWFVSFTCNWWSSAYMVMFPSSTFNGKSFWNMFQSKGNPCGHSRFIGFQMLVISPSFTLLRLFSKKDRIKSRDPLPKP